jgi:hypothetical protein
MTWLKNNIIFAVITIHTGKVGQQLGQLIENFIFSSVFLSSPHEVFGLLWSAAFMDPTALVYPALHSLILVPYEP